jgi:Ca2+-transporting ATPase
MAEALWYSLSPEETCARLNADCESGLTSAEAEARLARHGANAVSQRRRATIWQLLLEQFKDIIIIVLLAATAISAAMGEAADAIAIIIIVIMNACFGVVQEYRAEKSIEALRNLTAPVARVRRDGVASIIPATDVVPGDVLILSEGDRVPADARLFETTGLRPTSRC